MRAIVYDVAQGAGLLLIAGGTGIEFGWAAAMIVAGALLIGVTLLELSLLRR